MLKNICKHIFRGMFMPDTHEETCFNMGFIFVVVAVAIILVAKFLYFPSYYQENEYTREIAKLEEQLMQTEDEQEIVVLNVLIKQQQMEMEKQIEFDKTEGEIGFYIMCSIFAFIGLGTMFAEIITWIKEEKYVKEKLKEMESYLN